MTAQINLARSRLVGVVLPTPSRLPRHKYSDFQYKRPHSIRVGNIVGVERDAVTVWKSEQHMSFAYMQTVRVRPSGQMNLSIICLYAPSDTNCSTMHCAFQNELFFLNHCKCGNHELDAAEVVCKVPAALFSS